MSETRYGSVLAADFGNVNTRVVLIDLVDGRYRLVASGSGRTTIGYPVDDINVGLHRILNHLTEVTGRNFLNEDGKIIAPEQSDRSGVDHFLATGSVGRPMRAVIVGLLPEISVASALRAISSSYVEPVASIHLRDGKTKQERVNAILLGRPDVVFITGGTDQGAESALLEMSLEVHLGVSLINRSHRPAVIYAGNNRLIEPLRAMFAETTSFLVAQNVRPTIEKEEFETVQMQLSRAYHQFEQNRGESFASLASMTTRGIQPTAQSYALLTQYLARVHKTNVMAVDVGSAITMLTGVIGGRSNTLIRTDIGLGHSADTLAEHVKMTAISRNLPFYIRESEVINYTMNKVLRPATVPMNLRDLYLEQAMMRAGVEGMMKEARRRWQGLTPEGPMPPVGMILGAGGALTGTGHPAYNLLLLLDLLQPTGVTQVKIDPLGLIPALGALATINPEGVAQVLESDDLEHLGTVVSISGTPTVDQPALYLKITTEDGEIFDHEVMGGHLWALPLPGEHELRVEVRAARGLDIGGKSRLRLKLTGGTAGLVFDARGRPLHLAATAEERARQIPMWIHEMTGDPLQEIDERWLRPIADEGERRSAPRRERPTAERGGLFGRGGRKKEEERPELTPELPEDDEFMRLLGEEDGADEEEEPEDDLGALRNVLS